MNRITLLPGITYIILVLSAAAVNVRLIEPSYTVTATLTQNRDFVSPNQKAFLNTAIKQYIDVRPSIELQIFDQILFSPDIVNLVSINNQVVIPNDSYHENVFRNFESTPESITISQYIKKYCHKHLNSLQQRIYLYCQTPSPSEAKVILEALIQHANAFILTDLISKSKIAIQYFNKAQTETDSHYIKKYLSDMKLKEQTRLLKLETLQYPIQLTTDVEVSASKSAPTPFLIFVLYCTIALFCYPIILKCVSKSLLTNLRKI